MCCNDVLLIPSAITFDASIVQMFLAWSSGATMVLIAPNTQCKPNRIASLLQKTKMTVMQVSFLPRVKEELGSVYKLLLILNIGV